MKKFAKSFIVAAAVVAAGFSFFKSASCNEIVSSNIDAMTGDWVVTKYENKVAWIKDDNSDKSHYTPIEKGECWWNKAVNPGYDMACWIAAEWAPIE